MDFSDQQHIDNGRARPGNKADVEAVPDAEMNAVVELDEERLRAIEIITRLDDDGSFAASLGRLRAKIPAIVDAALADMQAICQPPVMQNNPWESGPDAWPVFKHTTLVWGPDRRRAAVALRSKIHQQRHTGVCTETIRIVPDPGFDLSAFDLNEPLSIRCGTYLARAQWRKIEATSSFCIETSAPVADGLRQQFRHGGIEIRAESYADLRAVSQAPTVPGVLLPGIEPKISAGVPRLMELST